MATLTGTALILTETDLAQFTTTAVRSVPYEHAAGLRRFGPALILTETDLTLLTSDATVHRNSNSVGYGGAGTLSIFGTGCVAPAIRRRE